MSKFEFEISKEQLIAPFAGRSSNYLRVVLALSNLVGDSHKFPAHTVVRRETESERPSQHFQTAWCLIVSRKFDKCHN